MLFGLYNQQESLILDFRFCFRSIYHRTIVVFGCRTHFSDINHTSIVTTFIELHTFMFLFVFFVSQAEINLLGETN
jgi:hypothetical protein